MKRSLTGGRRRCLLIIGTIVSVTLLFSFILSRNISEDVTRIRSRYTPGQESGDHAEEEKRFGIGFSEKSSHGEEVLPPAKGDLVIINEPVDVKRNKGNKKASAKCAKSNYKKCQDGAIYVQIGAETAKEPPYACFNDVAIFSDADISRGILAASIDDLTLEVKEVATFDLSTTDGRLIEWLSTQPARTVLVVVSFGDVAERLSLDARSALRLFGAQAAANWRGGSAYAALGQHALQEGEAKEIVVPLGAENDKKPAISDCFGFPLGKLNATVQQKKGTMNRVDEARLQELLRQQKGSQLTENKEVVLGNEWKQCGKRPSCAHDELAMHFYSGANKDDHPRMCVGGRMVFEAGLNGAGRGLNMAVIDQKSRKILRTGHFDTYEEDSAPLELFLDGLPEGDIVAVVSFDEASNKLSEMAKQIFYELGSSMVHRLKFRASWYFVGQKGIRGFSPFEDLYFPTGNAWAPPVDANICVPTSLSGPADRRSDKQNAAKRHFCAKYDRLDEFCDEAHLDDAIVPRRVAEGSRADDPVYNLPILVVAGESMGALRWTLQSLIEQPGINTQLVIVAHNMEYKMLSDLALLFHFKPLPINATSSYNDLLLSSLIAAFSIFPKASSLIVVESEVAATPDLLFYFSQLLPVVEQDRSVQLVHAFNYNGFERTSRSPSTVYRVDALQPPAYIFLIRRELVEQNIGDHSMAAMGGCCKRLHRWWLQMKEAAALVPEVSRVVVRKPNEITLQDTDEEAVFREQRRVAKDAEQKLSGVDKLVKAEYDKDLEMRRKSSVVTKGELWASCKGGYSAVLQKEEANWNGRPVLVEYATDDELLRIVKCIGLYSGQVDAGRFVAGAYQGSIRFSLNGADVLLTKTRHA